MLKSLALGLAVALVATACGAANASAPGTTSPQAEPAVATTSAPPAPPASADDDADGAHAYVPPAASPDRTITVTLTEFAIDADAVEITAGETVRFVVTNSGKVQHEFRLSNAERIAEHLAEGHQGHQMGEMATGVVMEEHNGDLLMLLDPGETAELVLTFPEDTTFFTEVACMIPGHFEAGMHRDLAVTG